MYYNFEKIEKYKKLFNFVITPRSAGKTIAMKKRVVDKYLSDGSRFVYIRRSATELENRKLSMFFQKMQSLGYHADHELTYESGFFYCDHEVIGYATPLSTSINERSVDFVGVSDIYFEEFCMRPTNHHNYLPDEVEVFLDLYCTIAREDEIPVWFLGNMLQEYNPYFLYFDINPPENGVKTWKDFAVEIWNEKNFIEQRRNTRFGKLVDGTNYGNYAIKNQGYANNHNFKRKLPAQSYPYFRVMYNQMMYTIYYCPDGSMQVTVGNGGGKTQIVVFNADENKPEYVPFKMFIHTLKGQSVKRSIYQNRFFHTNGRSEEVGNLIKRGCACA